METREQLAVVVDLLMGHKLTKIRNPESLFPPPEQRPPPVHGNNRRGNTRTERDQNDSPDSQWTHGDHSLGTPTPGGENWSTIPPPLLVN